MFVIAVCIALFGWNEIAWLLSNPLMLFFTVVLGGLGFVAFQLNLHSIIMPVIQPVMNTIFNVALTQGQRQLNNYMNSPQQQQAAPVTGAATATSNKAKTD